MFRDEEKFDFLVESPYFYDAEESNYTATFKFKDGLYRGLIGIPYDERKNMWYKYFVKGDKDSYAKNVPIEELPEWFATLFLESEEIIVKRDRLRKLFQKK